MEIFVNIAINIGCGLIGSVIGFFVQQAWTNRKRLKLLCDTKIRSNEQIRVSAAYLFRIKVNGKYLLIRGNRIASQYQPVGGVYKRHESSAEVLNGLNVVDDDSLRTCTTDNDDLRIRLPKKNLLKFLDWFDGRTGREVQVDRELSEELIANGFLEIKAGDFLDIEYLRSRPRKIAYSEHFDINELLLHEAFELRLEKSVQEQLAEAVKNSNGALVLATAEEINKGWLFLNNQSVTIASTAKTVL